MKVIEAHGADALRLYLINSPVVRAESLKFKEEGVQATVREVLLPWFNAFRFFVQQVGGGRAGMCVCVQARPRTGPFEWFSRGGGQVLVTGDVFSLRVGF